MNKIRILLADDHAILRDGLRYILNTTSDYEIVGEAGDGKEAIDKIEKYRPDIAILDISMPTITGIEISRQVKKYFPGTKIIILSRHDNEEYVNQVLKYGVNGYILKDDAGADLLKAISEIMKGNIYLSPRIMTRIVGDYTYGRRWESPRVRNSVFETLTSRETEILKLIAESKTNAEISAALRISCKTVKVHRANIMQKLHAHKVTDLVKYALKQGLVE